MALPASDHTASETVGQIGITNSVKGGDDLLLVGVCHFHFACCGHHVFMLCGILSPDFWGNMVDDSAGGGAARPGIMLQGLLSRGAHDMAIQEFSWRTPPSQNCQDFRERAPTWVPCECDLVGSGMQISLGG